VFAEFDSSFIVAQDGQSAIEHSHFLAQEVAPLDTDPFFPVLINGEYRPRSIRRKGWANEHEKYAPFLYTGRVQSVPSMLVQNAFSGADTARRLEMDHPNRDGMVVRHNYFARSLQGAGISC
jgi:hypothetical protein